MMLLHGEQFLSIKKDIPTSATLVSYPQLVEVIDKGKAASVVTMTRSYDKDSGELVLENQSTIFIRGSGGFGGRKTGKDRGAPSAVNKPPSRKPDAVVEEKTLERQAAIYRLSGDVRPPVPQALEALADRTGPQYNPLHIDPDFASVGGFEKPILHGLCFFGISGKHVYEKFGPFKDIKVRFTGSVYPGETIETHMWKEGDKVIFSACPSAHRPSAAAYTAPSSQSPSARSATPSSSAMRPRRCRRRERTKTLSFSYMIRGMQNVERLPRPTKVMTLPARVLLAAP